MLSKEEIEKAWQLLGGKGFDSLCAFADDYAIKLLEDHDYLIGEVERKDKTIAELRERINGELEVSEQVAQEREELILENEQMNEALKNIRTHYVSVHNEDWKKAYDEIWNMVFKPKGDEQK